MQKKNKKNYQRLFFSIKLQKQKKCASRLDHTEVRVIFTAAGATGSRLVSIWDQTRTWDPGD